MHLNRHVTSTQKVERVGAFSFGAEHRTHVESDVLGAPRHQRQVFVTQSGCEGVRAHEFVDRIHE
jgi:hypothetical protein